jgi:formylglycine-generating enzyme required for sulfatase activity
VEVTRAHGHEPMTLITHRRTACPRCGASVSGDFKFCPTCAFRLKPGDRAPEPSTPAGVTWPQRLLLASTGAVVAALVVIGVNLFGPPPPAPAPAATPTWRLREQLTVDEHLLELMVYLPGRVALLWPAPDGERDLPLRVGPVKLMKYEVTRGMYAEFLADCEADPSHVPPTLVDLWRPPDPRDLAYGRGHLDLWWEAVRRALPEGHRVERPADLDAPLPPRFGILPMVPPQWVYVTAFEELRWRPPDEAEANLPVTGVSFHDASAFAAWAGERVGETFRLPIEVEWIGGGRGTNFENAYPWGAEPRRYACNNLNFWGDEDQPRLKRVDWRYADPDGSTDEGLWAMSGNAREWTHRWTPVLHDNRTPDDPADDWYTADLDPAPPTAPTLGGSFRLGIHDCTVDQRSMRLEDKRARFDDVGFRLWQPPLAVPR